MKTKAYLKNSKAIFLVCLALFLGIFFNAYSEELPASDVGASDQEFAEEKIDLGDATTSLAAEIAASSTAILEEVQETVESFISDIVSTAATATDIVIDAVESIIDVVATSTPSETDSTASTTTAVAEPETDTSATDTSAVATTTIIVDPVVDMGTTTIDFTDATTTLVVDLAIATSTETIDLMTSTSTIATSTSATSTVEVVEKSEEAIVEEEQKDEEIIAAEDPAQIKRKNIIELITKNSGGDDSWLARPEGEGLINKLSQLTENNFITPDLPLAFKGNKIFWVDGSWQMIYGWDIATDNLFGTPIGNQEGLVLDFGDAGVEWRPFFEPMEKVLTFVSASAP